VTRVVAGAVERAARAATGQPVVPDQGGPTHDIAGHPPHRDWHHAR
jgi:hypothetical protein